jgi:hypothetical protein
MWKCQNRYYFCYLGWKKWVGWLQPWGVIYRRKSFWTNGFLLAPNEDRRRYQSHCLAILALHFSPTWRWNQNIDTAAPVLESVAGLNTLLHFPYCFIVLAMHDKMRIFLSKFQQEIDSTNSSKLGEGSIDVVIHETSRTNSYQVTWTPRATFFHLWFSWKDWLVW